MDGRDASELVNEIPLITWRRGCDSGALSVVHLYCDIALRKRANRNVDRLIYMYMYYLYGHRIYSLLE